MTTIVKFLRNHGTYFRGDVAGFEQDVAARLLSATPPVVALHIPTEGEAPQADAVVLEIARMTEDLRVRGEDLAAREMALAEREVELASREAALAEREAALADEQGEVIAIIEDDAPVSPEVAKPKGKADKAPGEPPTQGG